MNIIEIARVLKASKPVFYGGSSSSYIMGSEYGQLKQWRIVCEFFASAIASDKESIENIFLNLCGPEVIDLGIKK